MLRVEHNPSANHPDRHEIHDVHAMVPAVVLLVDSHAVSLHLHRLLLAIQEEAERSHAAHIHVHLNATQRQKLSLQLLLQRGTLHTSFEPHRARGHARLLLLNCNGPERVRKRGHRSRR